MKENLVNIRNDTDEFARYRMPDLELRTKHNLTFVLNLKEISKALHVDHKALAKSLAQSLSTGTKFLEKSDEFQINGLHGKEKIMLEVRNFIKNYILCPTCDLPELTYLPKKKLLGIRCMACGWRGKGDLNDKILKIIHQSELTKPKSKTMKNKVIEKMDKIVNENTKQKQSKQKKSDQPFQNEFVFDSISNSVQHHNNENSEEDDDWAMDLTPEAVEARRLQEINSQTLKDLF